MDFRHASALGLLLAVLSAAPVVAQQSPASTAPDPYNLHRPHAYTSADNPYAPGAIYDPYRVTNLATLSGKSATDSKATTGGVPHSKSGKRSALHDTGSGSDTTGTAASSASYGNNMSGTGSSHCQGNNGSGKSSTTIAARQSGSAGSQYSTKKKAGCSTGSLGSGSSGLGSSAAMGLNRSRPPQSPQINQRHSQQKGP